LVLAVLVELQIEAYQVVTLYLALSQLLVVAVAVITQLLLMAYPEVQVVVRLILELRALELLAKDTLVEHRQVLALAAEAALEVLVLIQYQLMLVVLVVLA
jgi:hypothetical protein